MISWGSHMAVVRWNSVTLIGSIQHPNCGAPLGWRLRYHDAPITAKDKMQSRKHTHTHAQMCVCVCVCVCVIVYVGLQSSIFSLGPQGEIFSHGIYNASADWQRQIPLFLSFLGDNLNPQKSLQTHSGNLKLGCFLWFFLGCRIPSLINGLYVGSEHPIHCVEPKKLCRVSADLF